jgi:hypothetical protein
MSAMTRLGAAFWLVLVVVAGFTTFEVKYAVQDTEDQLVRMRKQTAAEQQEIRVLTAEWTFLTQPERLAELNKKFLGLTSVSTKQLQRGIEQIPLRPPPIPPPELLAELSAEPTPPPPPAETPPPATIAEATPTKPARVQLAKAEAPAPLGSLDALIAQIADTR